MSVNLLWMQTGACSGDTMALLCAEKPDLLEFFRQYQINLLWHPSLSTDSPEDLQKTIDDIRKGRKQLNILCIEGAILHGPDNTGMFDSFCGRPKKEVVKELCNKANIVVAVGTCSSFGGIPAAPPNPTDATGLQWTKDEEGGLLPPDWKSQANLPVINIPGCPTHPASVIQTLGAFLQGVNLPLDHLNRPSVFFETMVHQGCTRNEYHEFDVEDTAFGSAACLYFNLGCQGPFTSANCNSTLWNGRSSKPRSGVPCFGCTNPKFPREKNLFKTDKIGDIPVEMPLGVKRPNYMAYKGLAKAATPQRLIDRANKL